MEVRIVRVDGFLIVGEMDCGVAWGLKNVIKHPMLVQTDPNGMLVLTHFIGEPKEITVSNSRMTFGYVLEDADMVRRYREAITGLVLPGGKNVVNIRGKQ